MGAGWAWAWLTEPYPQAAVNVLLGILNHKGPQAASAEGRQRGAERGLLLRPVICICNDL